MKKMSLFILGVYCSVCSMSVFSAEKFDILPDLPEPLAAAQASSVSTVKESAVSLSTGTAGNEPSIISVVFSLLFVILLIYFTGIIYAKLNKASLNSLKKQIGDTSSKVAVVSTTPLGGNKTLHVVELDGKRMLIGASQNSIHLIKDLGSYPSVELHEGEYSKIEIPNIRIPKIEIPKIEFPNIGFTKAFMKKEEENSTEDNTNEIQEKSENNDKFEISDIYEEESDGIIDKLFQTTPSSTEQSVNETSDIEHKVDPDEYALYKKYL